MTLLIVYHSRTGGSRLMAEAARDAAAEEGPARLLRAEEAEPEDLLDADNGTAMITQPRVKQVSHPTNITWSDACREVDGNFSGAGGFSPKGGGFLWWYKFSDYHLQHLAIHVLEAAAEVVTLAFVAEGTRADAREGETAACLQFSDNMAWVTSVQGDKPTDPRLRDILQVRHDLQDRYQLDAQIAYVNTKVNVVADLVSRGDAAEARAARPNPRPGHNPNPNPHPLPHLSPSP